VGFKALKHMGSGLTGAKRYKKRMKKKDCMKNKKIAKKN
jgi:hypothetical protein